MNAVMSARFASAALTVVLLVGCTSATQRTRPIPPPSGGVEDPTTTSPSTSPTKSIAPLAPPALQKYCRPKDPLAGVYSPARLRIKNPCVAVTGVVQSTNREHDGDLHISLVGVDPKWLNSVNQKRLYHDLVVEAVPDIPMPIPATQSHITVVGPWVLDTETGWMEVHPVWAIVPAS
jgi:hypothetical protein